MYSFFFFCPLCTLKSRDTDSLPTILRSFFFLFLVGWLALNGALYTSSTHSDVHSLSGIVFCLTPLAEVPGGL